MTRGFLAFAVSAFALVLGVADAQFATEARAQAAKGKTWVVEMDNMNFGRFPDTARVGDSIIWVNKDTVQHSATAKDGSFDVRLQPGQKGRTVLAKAGTIAVSCIYHAMMRGTIKVAAG